MIALLAAAGVSVALAIFAYLLNVRSEAIKAKHSAELEWVGLQLRDLYGPLFVLAEENERTWRAFRSAYLPPIAERRGTNELTDAQQDLWRKWVTVAFLPSARRMRDIILQHGHLFIGSEIPETVLEFCSHVTSYEMLTTDWSSGLSDGSPIVRHPGDAFIKYITHSYQTLRTTHEILRETYSLK